MIYQVHNAKNHMLDKPMKSNDRVCLKDIATPKIICKKERMKKKEKKNSVSLDVQRAWSRDGKGYVLIFFWMLGLEYRQASVEPSTGAA